jgi:hypothetical protein
MMVEAGEVTIKFNADMGNLRTQLAVAENEVRRLQKIGKQQIPQAIPGFGEQLMQAELQRDVLRKAVKSQRDSILKNLNQETGVLKRNNSLIGQSAFLMGVKGRVIKAAMQAFGLLPGGTAVQTQTGRVGGQAGVVAGAAAGAVIAPAAAVAPAAGAAAGGAAAAGMAGIAGALGAMLPLLGFLALVPILVEGFSGTLKLLGIVVKVLSLILKPIDLMLMMLILPLVRLFLPFLRIWLMILTPFRRALAERLAARAKAPGGMDIAGVLIDIVEVFSAFITTAFAGIAGQIGKMLMDQIGGAVEILATIIGGLVVAINPGMAGAVAVTIGSIRLFKENMKTGIDDAVKAIQESLLGIVSYTEDKGKAWLTTWDNILIGIASAFNTDFGTKLSDVLSFVNEAVAATKSSGEELAGMLSDLTDKIKDETDPALVAFYSTTLVGLSTKITSLSNDDIKTVWMGALETVSNYLRTTAITAQGDYKNALIAVADEAEKQVNRLKSLVGQAQAAQITYTLPGLSAGATAAEIAAIQQPKISPGEALIKGIQQKFNLPPFAQGQEGGVVGREGLAYIHRGETITPAGERNEANITNNITVNASVSSDMDIRDLADKLSRYMHLDMSRRISYGTRVV